MPLMMGEIEISTDNSSWSDIAYYGLEVYIENGTLLIDGLDAETTYYFRARNSSTNWTYLSIRTEAGGVDQMIIGMMILILAIMGFFGFIGYVYSKEESFMFYLCYLFWYMALFFPLFGLRILANAEGISTNEKLLIETFYSVYLRIYWFLIVILVAYFIVLFLSWLWFWHKKPAWKRKKLEL